jgi:hypothetical protein
MPKYNEEVVVMRPAAVGSLGDAEPDAAEGKVVLGVVALAVTVGASVPPRAEGSSVSWRTKTKIASIASPTTARAVVTCVFTARARSFDEGVAPKSSSLSRDRLG